MKKIWSIIILGVILRVFLSFSTFHPDVMAFKLGGDTIASGKILNLYDHSDLNIAILNYPPLIYFYHGLFTFSGNLLFNDFPSTPFGIKLHYLIFDLLIVFIFSKLFQGAREKFLSIVLWMFNPINLYATYMMGQFDIIPTFFTLLSVYFAAKNQIYTSAISLGFAIAFKLYPIFLIIPLIIIGKNFFEKVKIFSLTVLPYILSITAYINTPSFRENALLTNQASKSLYAAISVSGGESILLFPFSLVFYYLMIWKKNVEPLWKYYLIPLLLFFIFTHFHPQWLIWVTPFFIMDLVINRFKNLLPIALIIVLWFISLFFFDPTLTVRIFAPIFPNTQNIPDIWTMLKIPLNYNFSQSFVQTILAASSIYLIYKLFPTNEKSQV